MGRLPRGKERVESGPPAADAMLLGVPEAWWKLPNAPEGGGWTWPYDRSFANKCTGSVADASRGKAVAARVWSMEKSGMAYS